MRLLTEHRQDLRQFGVKSLALFGSVVRDEARLDSDVDMLVEFEGAATFDRYMGLRFFLEDLLGTPVDLVTRKALKPRLRPYVEREAQYVA
jgi:predicted nucleotidyltransferase